MRRMACNAQRFHCKKAQTFTVRAEQVFFSSSFFSCRLHNFSLCLLCLWTQTIQGYNTASCSGNRNWRTTSRRNEWMEVGDAREWLLCSFLESHLLSSNSSSSSRMTAKKRPSSLHFRKRKDVLCAREIFQMLLLSSLLVHEKRRINSYSHLCVCFIISTSHCVVWIMQKIRARPFPNSNSSSRVIKKRMRANVCCRRFFFFFSDSLHSKPQNDNIVS